MANVSDSAHFGEDGAVMSFHATPLEIPPTTNDVRRAPPR
jgi:hypothetical protein